MKTNFETKIVREYNKKNVRNFNSNGYETTIDFKI